MSYTIWGRVVVFLLQRLAGFLRICAVPMHFTVFGLRYIYNYIYIYMDLRVQFQGQLDIFIQAVYYWGSILETKELATLTGRVPELCGWAPWLGSVSRPCPGLVLLLSCLGRALNSVAGCRQKIVDEAACSWGEGRAYQEIDF